MDKESYSWGGIGFLALFFLIVVAFMFNRNGCGGWSNGWGNGCAGWGFNGFGVGVPGYGLGFEDYKAICASEKQEIINSARTQYLVEEQANLTRANDTANANMLSTKIDFYAYQDLRDRLAEEQRKVLTLENQLFVKDQLAPLTASVTDIRCNMLTKPVVNGLGTSCNPIITPYPLGFNGCGCNGLV